MGGSSINKSPPEGDPEHWRSSEEIHRLHALFPTRSRCRRARYAWHHSRTSIRQSRIGESRCAGKIVPRTRIANRGSRTSVETARFALPGELGLIRRVGV